MIKNCFLFLLGFLLFASCQHRPQVPMVRPVKSMIVGESELSGKIFPGHVEASEHAELNFRVGGMLQEFRVNEGQNVQKGELIAALDPRDFRLKIEAQKATYEQAAAQQERYKKLYQRGAISRQEYEQSTAASENAASAYQKMQNEMSDTRLTAPFDGNIEKKYVENYQEVIAGEKIIRLINPKKLDFHFVLPEINVQFTNRPLRYSIEMEVNKGVFYTAKVKEIVHSSVSGSGIPVILTIDDPEFMKIRVLPGYAGNVKLEIAANADTVISIPLSCIYFDTGTGQQAVWKIQPSDSTVVRSLVTTGNLTKESEVLILWGLEKGDRIVSAGVNRLHEGDKVKFLE